MDMLNRRKQIESLSSEQLAQELINNGYAFTYQAIIDKDITGKKMMNMSELEKNELSFVMSRIQLQLFWSYVMSVKNDPTQMVLSSQYTGGNNTPSIQKPLSSYPKPPMNDGGRFAFPPKPKAPKPMVNSLQKQKPPEHLQKFLPPKPNFEKKPDIKPKNELFATSKAYPFGSRQVQEPAVNVAIPSVVRNNNEKFETSSKYPFKFRRAEEHISNKEKEQTLANMPVDPFATSSVYPFKNRAKPVDQRPPSPVVESPRTAHDKFTPSSKYPFRRSAFENAQNDYDNLQQTVPDGLATSSASPFRSPLPSKLDLPKPPELDVFKKKPLPVVPAKKPKEIAPPPLNNYSYKQKPTTKFDDPNLTGLGKPKDPPPSDPSKDEFLAKRNLISSIFSGNRPKSQPNSKMEDPIYINVVCEEFYNSAEDSFTSDESFQSDTDEREYGNHDINNVPASMPQGDQLPLPPTFLLPVYEPVISVNVDQDVENLLHPPLPMRPRVTILNLSRKVGNERLIRSEQGDFLFRTSNTHYCVLMIKTNSGQIANIPIVKRDNLIHLDATNMEATKYFDNLKDLADYYKMQDTKMGNTTIRFRNMLT